MASGRVEAPLPVPPNPPNLPNPGRVYPPLTPTASAFAPHRERATSVPTPKLWRRRRRWRAGSRNLQKNERGRIMSCHFRTREEHPRVGRKGERIELSLLPAARGSFRCSPPRASLHAPPARDVRSQSASAHVVARCTASCRPLPSPRARYAPVPGRIVHRRFGKKRAGGSRLTHPSIRFHRRLSRAPRSPRAPRAPRAPAPASGFARTRRNSPST